MKDPDNQLTSRAGTRSHDYMTDGVLPNSLRTGSIAEFSRRMGAWLAWRDGVAPKPEFKFYDPEDKSTWFVDTNAAPVLRGAIRAQITAAKKRKENA